VDIQDHVAGAVADCRVGVGCAIVEELDDFYSGVFRCCLLLRSEAAEAVMIVPSIAWP
jgi:hypothetical protein